MYPRLASLPPSHPLRAEAPSVKVSSNNIIYPATHVHVLHVGIVQCAAHACNSMYMYTGLHNARKFLALMCKCACLVHVHHMYHYHYKMHIFIYSIILRLLRRLKRRLPVVESWFILASIMSPLSSIGL